MYKVIRVSADHELVIVQFNPDNNFTPDSAETSKFYLYCQWMETPRFAETSAENTLCYFSGHADGIDWGKLPEQLFASLEEVETWRQKGEMK